MVFTCRGAIAPQWWGWSWSPRFHCGSSSAAAAQSHSWPTCTWRRTRWLCQESATLEEKRHFQKTLSEEQNPIRPIRALHKTPVAYTVSLCRPKWLPFYSLKPKDFLCTNRTSFTGLICLYYILIHYTQINSRQMLIKFLFS